MQINLTPMRCDDRLTLERRGDVLAINDTDYNFSQLPEGAVLPRAAVDCPLLASDVTRVAGVLRLTLILPHGAAAPPETLFPAPILLTTDGSVDVPAFDAPLSETSEDSE